MKTKSFWINAGIILAVCALAALLTLLPIAGVVKTMLPGMVISLIVLFVCRGELRVLPCIFGVLVSLAGLPMFMLVVMTSGMLLVVSAPAWVSGILCEILGVLSTLAILLLAYRIVRLGEIGIVTRTNVLVAVACSLLYAVLQGASCGFVYEPSGTSVVELLLFLSRLSPIFELLSQMVFYGAICYFGILMWREVSGDVSNA